MPPQLPWHPKVWTRRSPLWYRLVSGRRWTPAARDGLPHCVWWLTVSQATTATVYLQLIFPTVILLTPSWTLTIYPAPKNWFHTIILVFIVFTIPSRLKKTTPVSFSLSGSWFIPKLWLIKVEDMAIRVAPQENRILSEVLFNHSDLSQRYERIPHIYVFVYSRYMHQYAHIWNWTPTYMTYMTMPIYVERFYVMTFVSRQMYCEKVWQHFLCWMSSSGWLCSTVKPRKVIR